MQDDSSQDIVSDFDQVILQKKPYTFILHNRGSKHETVELCGSFDGWKQQHPMKFDTFNKQWFLTLHLKSGNEYLYKYIVNKQNWIVNQEEPTLADKDGNLNNLCVFEEQ